MATILTTAAPAIDDCAGPYERWRRTHLGNRADFLVFMTTPGVERDRFMTEEGASPDVRRGVLTLTVNV
jgi:hypothetical protein